MVLPQRHDQRAAIFVPDYGKAAGPRAKSKHLADEQRAVPGPIALLEHEPPVALAVQRQQDEIVAGHPCHADAGWEIALGKRRREAQIAARRQLAGLGDLAHARALIAANSLRMSSMTCSIANATGSLSSAPGSSEPASTSSTSTSAGKPGPSNQRPNARA